MATLFDNMYQSEEGRSRVEEKIEVFRDSGRPVTILVIAIIKQALISTGGCTIL